MGSIMGGRNEQAALRSINTDRSVRAVNFKRSNSQVKINSYNIDELEPSVIAVNELNTNTDTCCLGETFTVLRVTSRTTDVYK